MPGLRWLNSMWASVFVFGRRLCVDYNVFKISLLCCIALLHQHFASVLDSVVCKNSEFVVSVVDFFLMIFLGLLPSLIVLSLYVFVELRDTVSHDELELLSICGNSCWFSPLTFFLRQGMTSVSCQASLSASCLKLQVLKCLCCFSFC